MHLVLPDQTWQGGSIEAAPDSSEICLKSEDYPRKKTDFVLYVFRFCFIRREKQMILRFRIQ